MDFFKKETSDAGDATATGDEAVGSGQEVGEAQGQQAEAPQAGQQAEAPQGAGPDEGAQEVAAPANVPEFLKGDATRGQGDAMARILWNQAGASLPEAFGLDVPVYDALPEELRDALIEASVAYDNVLREAMRLTVTVKK